jgi:CelD/BcsL family acetyltransferase involved in cellulose biosynthesis
LPQEQFLDWRSTLRLVLHHEIPENEDLRRQWNELVQRMESPEVFYTYEWALAVSRGYKPSVRPMLMLAYERDALVGVAALAIAEAQQKVSFLAGNTADYCDFVSDPSRRLEFVNLVLREVQSLSSHLALPNLPASSATAWALKDSSFRQGCAHFSRPAFQCPQVDLSASVNREPLKRAMRGKQTIRRRINAMARAGLAEVRHLTDGHEISEALAAFREAHLQRFFSMGRISNLADPQRWHFLIELARLLSGQGWMTLSRLTLAGQPIAWVYGFNFGGSWFYYQPAFDIRFSRYNPGLCLLARIVEDACDNREIQRVDLGLGDEEYKQRFATGHRETVRVTVTSSVVHHVGEKLRYHAASAIKSVPPLEHCIRWLLGKTVAGGAGA